MIFYSIFKINLLYFLWILFYFLLFKFSRQVSMTEFFLIATKLSCGNVSGNCSLAHLISRRKKNEENFFHFMQPGLKHLVLHCSMLHIIIFLFAAFFAVFFLSLYVLWSEKNIIMMSVVVLILNRKHRNRGGVCGKDKKDNKNIFYIFFKRKWIKSSTINYFHQIYNIVRGYNYFFRVGFLVCATTFFYFLCSNKWFILINENDQLILWIYGYAELAFECWFWLDCDCFCCENFFLAN